MKKLFLFLAIAMMSAAVMAQQDSKVLAPSQAIATAAQSATKNKANIIDSSDNVLTAQVLPVKNLNKVPIVIGMTNPTVPMTCIQCFIEPPCVENKFFHAEDGNVGYVPTKRWGPQHQAIFAKNPKNYPNSLMMMVVSTSSSNFTETEGAIATVFFNASSLADGDYTVKIKGANMVWTDRHAVTTYLCPDIEAPFTIKKGRIVKK